MSTQWDELIAERELKRVTCLMVALASACIIVRAGSQAWKRNPMQLPDYFVYSAYIFFLAMSMCYLSILPTVYRLGRAGAGMTPPWATMEHDITVSIRMMFVTTLLFWFSLWSVKFSLLALYKRLLVGLPGIYVRLWWAVLAFCLISLVGCIAAYLTSCEDFAAAMRSGSCMGSRSVRGQVASLYLAYGVDVLSDIMIMLLPLRIVWNLQIPRGQKTIVVALFASGLVCIAFATLRVVQVGRKSGATKSPDATWLALWTVIETSVTVCIGCGPAFVIFCRTVRSTREGNGYNVQPLSCPDGSPQGPEVMRMNTVSVGVARARRTRRDPFWDDDKSSQEGLAPDEKGIMVTTTLHQDHEPGSTRRNSLAA